MQALQFSTHRYLKENFYASVPAYVGWFFARFRATFAVLPSRRSAVTRAARARACALRASWRARNRIPTTCVLAERCCRLCAPHARALRALPAVRARLSGSFEPPRHLPVRAARCRAVPAVRLLRSSYYLGSPQFITCARSVAAPLPPPRTVSFSGAFAVFRVGLNADVRAAQNTRTAHARLFPVLDPCHTPPRYTCRFAPLFTAFSYTYCLMPPIPTLNLREYTRVLPCVLHGILPYARAARVAFALFTTYGFLLTFPDGCSLGPVPRACRLHYRAVPA